MAEILSTTSRVQVPYIVVTIGEYTFGLYAKTKTTVEVNRKYYTAIKTTYPNYMKSLVVKKVNGSLNSYTLTMEYGITQTDDPNMFEKVFSSVSKSRKITFTYGDCATPSYMYRKEEALITKITSSLDTANAKITYVISAVSSALKASAGLFNFPAYTSRKPSDVIIELLRNKQYGLQDIFYGMHDVQKVLSSQIILRDDKSVTIPAKTSITPWDYIGYLVTCMVCNTDSDVGMKSTRYTLTVHDDVSDTFDGPYFQINRITTSLQQLTSVDYYTINVGYPDKDFVSSFAVNDDQSYAVLYNYADEIQQSNYIYRIDDDGNPSEIFSPTLTNSKSLYKTTESDRTWWSDITQFPVKATMTIRGLLRAILLMSYIKVNVYYYGKKHISSGVYVVTQQEDTINQQGYFTTLSLLRVGGDNNAN